MPSLTTRVLPGRVKLQCSKFHRGRRGKQDIYLSVVSVYAPTYHSPQKQKDMFYDDLCCTINSVCEDDLLIVLGNFNPKVGKATSELEKFQWKSSERVSWSW